jgi:hypothetical protein
MVSRPRLNRAVACIRRLVWVKMMIFFGMMFFSVHLHVIIFRGLNFVAVTKITRTPTLSRGRLKRLYEDCGMVGNFF